MKTFICSKCGKEKQSDISGGTGYGLDVNDNKICYECCADTDREYMRAHGKIILYLTFDLTEVRNVWQRGTFSCNGHVSNWPGSLKFPIRAVRIGLHNLASWRYDVWFIGPDGEEWHGVQYGDNTEIVHCKRLKNKRQSLMKASGHF